jgi:hypothetical protein
MTQQAINDGNVPSEIRQILLLALRCYVHCSISHNPFRLPPVCPSIVLHVLLFVIAIITTFSFHQNWQVRPLAPRQCAFKPQNFYVGAVLNVFTDAILLSIPIPMLWALQVRLSKKIAIGVLLSSGLFVIGAAVTRAVLTLGSAPSGLNINRWGVRETIVGILTVNMPILPPMFKRAFWSTSSYHDSYSAEESRSKARYGNGTYELRS